MSSVVELLSVDMTIAAHKVANNVIKYLRWRNWDESGMVAAGFIGVAFDIAEPLSTPAEYCECFLVARGQVGYRLPHTTPSVCRDWVNESMSGHLGIVDARLGLRGPVWDIYVIVTLALAGGVARTVYLHPNLRREGDEGRRRDARGASAQLAWRDRPWSAREVVAFIPGHASTCAPARTAGADWLGKRCPSSCLEGGGER